MLHNTIYKTHALYVMIQILLSKTIGNKVTIVIKNTKFNLNKTLSTFKTGKN